MTVAEIVLSGALERWWNGESLPCDRFTLLENIGVGQPRKYYLWRWCKLPSQVRELAANFAMNGRPLEFLRGD